MVSLLKFVFLFDLLFVPQLLSQPKGLIAKLPDIILWAWERPEDLRFIDPQKVAVAFLANSIELTKGEVRVRPRLQHLLLPYGTLLIAVTRISTSDLATPLFSDHQRNKTLAYILDSSRLPGVRGIQIDFDAKVSERPFYHDLLNRLHRELPDSISLTITALASWCLYDTWIDSLPLDDAVPMLFRLGPDRKEVLRQFQSGKGFTIAVCQQSVGISIDEQA
ncbi:MAG TPA: hypothetical protein VMM58_05895, partial [Bacteroidota bacterium]|nr:hypothetical protein [Bacteroidota bacterium]